MTVDEFNALPAQEAHDALALCCVSERWIAPVLAGRPYDSRDTLLTVADTVWAQMHSPEALPLWRNTSCRPTRATRRSAT
jgi:hypothetical protein